MALIKDTTPEQDPSQAGAQSDIPEYMQSTYYWAYVKPSNVYLLDRDFVVWTILWGQNIKLMRALFKEIKPGSHVFQSSYVYGHFLEHFARHLGPEGKLDVIDVVPLQVENSKRRLQDFPHASARLADAESADGGPYDVVSCYFLLHEIPDEKKVGVVNNLLEKVSPGGKLVFTDYHKPCRFHPLKYLMYFVWHMLEPYAFGLIESEIQNFARDELRGQFEWRKETFFGGLYQKVVATRL